MYMRVGYVHASHSSSIHSISAGTYHLYVERLHVVVSLGLVKRSSGNAMFAISSDL